METTSNRTRKPCKAVGCANLSRATSGLCVTHRTIPAPVRVHPAWHTGEWTPEAKARRASEIARRYGVDTITPTPTPIAQEPEIDPTEWTASEWAFAIVAAVAAGAGLVAAIIQHGGF